MQTFSHGEPFEKGFQNGVVWNPSVINNLVADILAGIARK